LGGWGGFFFLSSFCAFGVFENPAKRARGSPRKPLDLVAFRFSFLVNLNLYLC
jgi:hypothetical protein